MKLCFVIPSLDFLISHRLELIKSIGLDHEVEVLTDLQGQNYSQLKNISEEIFTFTHMPIRRNSSPGGLFSHLLLLRKKLLANAPNRIFFVTLELSVAGAILSRIIQTDKNYFIISGIGPFLLSLKPSYRFIKVLYIFIFKIFLRKKNALFIFQNSTDQKIFKEHIIGAHLPTKIILGNGILIPTKNINHALGFDELRFCFIGRLAKSKGIKEFVSAAKFIHCSNPKIKFLIAGSYNANAKDYLSEEFYNELLSSQFLNFIQEVSHEKILDLYQPGDVFVLPSYGEGVPKAALEAASISIPLILTDVAGCNECIKDNGFLVSSHNSYELIGAMEKFIQQPSLLEVMGPKSRQLIIQKFKLEIITQEYKRLLEP